MGSAIVRDRKIKCMGQLRNSQGLGLGDRGNCCNITLSVGSCCHNQMPDMENTSPSSWPTSFPIVCLEFPKTQ